MKVYIRVRHSGECFNQNCFDALIGCEQLKIETVPFRAVYAIEDYDPKDPIVGSLQDTEVAMESLGLTLPLLDYPEELSSFLGRKIWKSTLFNITSSTDGWHVFVKPVSDIKRFSGTILDNSEDVIKLGGGVEDIEVWCSEKVNFLSEWRLWVMEGNIIGLTPYQGRWDVFPDAEILKRAVSEFKSAPAAYALDFGVTDDGRTLLVEASDGYSLRSFGLDPALYVKFLATRWRELTADKNEAGV